MELTDKEKLLDFAKLLQEAQLISVHAIGMVNAAASFVVKEVENM